MPAPHPTPTPSPGGAQAAPLSHQAAQALAAFKLAGRKLARDERELLRLSVAGEFDMLSPRSHSWQLMRLRSLIAEAAAVNPK
jgi:hypothetical protein